MYMLKFTTFHVWNLLEKFSFWNVGSTIFLMAEFPANNEIAITRWADNELFCS